MVSGGMQNTKELLPLQGGYMGDKGVYKWSAFSGSDAFPLGGPNRETGIFEWLFESGHPLDQAITKWKNIKSVKSVLNGIYENDENYTQREIDEVNRTLAWYENRGPLPYVSDFKKEELEEMDTMQLSFQVPFGNQRMLDVLNDVCPNDYEAFPIEIYTKTGISTAFFLINVCHQIHNALNIKQCIYEKHLLSKEGEENFIFRFKRLLFNKGCMGSTHLSRMYEHMTDVMVSKTLVQAFEKANIYGYNTMVFEDRVNSLYTNNYMPDGKTLAI